MQPTETVLMWPFDKNQMKIVMMRMMAMRYPCGTLAKYASALMRSCNLEILPSKSASFPLQAYITIHDQQYCFHAKQKYPKCASKGKLICQIGAACMHDHSFSTKQAPSLCKAEICNPIQHLNRPICADIYPDPSSQNYVFFSLGRNSGIAIFSTLQHFCV